MKLKFTSELTDSLPILGLILLLGGNLKVFLYYKLFRPEIFPFIALEELITLPMQNSLAYLLLLLLSLYAARVFFSNPKIRELDNTTRLRGRLFTYVSNLHLFLLFLLLSVLSIAFGWLQENVSPVEAGYLIVAFFVSTYCVPVIAQEINFTVWKKGTAGIPTLVMIMVFVTFSIFAASSAMNEGAKVKQGYYQHVVIVFDTARFHSDTTHYYIGQTKDYIFTYHAPTQSTTAYPISSVRSITF